MRYFRQYFLLALLTSFIVGVAYYVNAKSINADIPTNTAIPEVADYERDIEDNIDDDPLFIASSLLSQSLDLDWVSLVNLNSINPRFNRVSYRARPRSPPTI